MSCFLPSQTLVLYTALSSLPHFVSPTFLLQSFVGSFAPSFLTSSKSIVSSKLQCPALLMGRDVWLLTLNLLQMPLTIYACSQAPASLHQSPRKFHHKPAKPKSPSSIPATKSSTAPVLLFKPQKVWWSCQKIHPLGRSLPAARKTCPIPLKSW